MNTLFILMTIQIVLGAFDNFWHHEITERLPTKRSARGELSLHTAREFLYSVIFFAIAWYEWHGFWAGCLAALFVIEIGITVTDFLVEDQTRRLPPLERVLHTVLAINVGAVLAVFAPILWQWAAGPAGVVRVDYGAWSWLLSFAGLGILVWSARDLLAVARLMRPPEWRRDPIRPGECEDARSILVTGGTGFIGTHLARYLTERGDRVTVLTRDTVRAEECFGPHVRIIESTDAINDDEHFDAIINLAGAPIIGWPWTRARRRQLLKSRLGVTRSLVHLIARLRCKPRVLVTASAIGYYGVRSDEVVNEGAGAQRIFQSRLCQLWEKAATRAEIHGTRVCRLRMGLVLGRNGGALPQMMASVRVGMGAVTGSGRQWMSWIHVDDLVRLVDFVIDERSVDGPLNATSPEPVRHKAFMHAAGRVLRRPILARIPAPLLRALLGEMAQLFVDGQRVLPRRVQLAGFEFNYPTIEEAFADLLPNTSGSQEPGPLEVFYNGACPVCSAEVNHYARIADSAKVKLQLTDISRHPGALSSFGLEQADVKRRLYVQDVAGRLHAGVDAFGVLWSHLGPYRWCGRALALPGVSQAATLLYEGVLAPTLARYNVWRDGRTVS